MKRAVAASCCLLLCGRAWSFSVTMPTDTPVTLDFDDLERRERRPDPPAREREPREYREPSASSADPAEALAALAAILAAPVVIVGGAIYLAGKRFTDWLEETRRAWQPETSSCRGTSGTSSTRRSRHATPGASSASCRGRCCAAPSSRAPEIGNSRTRTGTRRTPNGTPWSGQSACATATRTTRRCAAT